MVTLNLVRVKKEDPEEKPVLSRIEGRRVGRGLQAAGTAQMKGEGWPEQDMSKEQKKARSG